MSKRQTVDSPRKGSPSSSQVSSNSSNKKPVHSLFTDALHLFLATASIYTCYIVYGVMQEKLYKGSYGPASEHFSYSLFLVFVQSIANLAFGYFLCLVEGTSLSKDSVPSMGALSVVKPKYVKISFSYMGAMFASNAALAFVNYPTQALAKSCKMVPVMIAGVFINGKKYSAREYGTVLLITGGIAVFMMSGASKKGSGNETSLFGLLLLFVSLALDGYTGPTQESIMKEHNPSQNQLMVFLNLYAVLAVGVVLVATGQMQEAVGFITRNPSVMLDLGVYSVLSAIGQKCILTALFRFNSLVVTTITTTRKFFTIMASVMWFGHELNARQWGGVALVFAGLGAEIQNKYSKKKALAKQTAKATN